MDSYSFKVGLVTIQADGESPVYLTNHSSTLIIGTKTYLASPEMDISNLPDKTGAVDTSEGTIRNISSALYTQLANIAGGYPYNQIEVTVDEGTMDDAFTLLSTRRHFTGLVYQAKPMLEQGYLDLVVKDWKYYLDIPGGMPCTEQCFVKNFGDSKLCQATVSSYPVTISSISGYDVIVSSVPVVDDFLFNKGYFKLNGTSIKIKFWESGTTFQTAEAMPASWDGLVVTLVAGCDKTLATCRDIHNNEEHFSAWGYSMVDYDPQFEEPTT